MDDEYYEWDDKKFMDIGRLSSIHELECFGLQPGVPSVLWEWMAGSGRLSSSARSREVTHLPPVDYRWGINLGHWYHQLVVLWNMLIFPVDVLYASPTCTPWGSNARQWTYEERTSQRNSESLTLQFLAVAFFIQMLMGRAWVLEQPAGSDLIRASAMSTVIGNEDLGSTYSFLFDQCMLGAHSEGVPTEKRTGLWSNKPFRSPPPQCDGSHRHCILRGSDTGGSRTAQAAVYPKPMCALLISEIQATSDEIRSGGRAAEINAHRLRDPQHHGHTLQKILPELRLLAQHRGPEFLHVFDAIVVPWARTALGKRYDENLSMMHIVSLPEVHRRNKTSSLYCPVQSVGVESAESGGVPDKTLVEIQKSLEEIKANMTRINDVNSPARPVQVGGSSGSTDPAPTERSGENLVPERSGENLVPGAGSALWRSQREMNSRFRGK